MTLLSLLTKMPWLGALDTGAQEQRGSATQTPAVLYQGCELLGFAPSSRKPEPFPVAVLEVVVLARASAALLR